MSYDDHSQSLLSQLDRMKREPCKSPFEEMVIDYLEELTEMLCGGAEVRVGETTK